MTVIFSLFMGDDVICDSCILDTNPITVETIILQLVSYFFPVNFLSKQKRAMRRGMRKPRSLKVGRYAVRLIELNEYLDFFPAGTLYEKIRLNELNEILVNSMPNSWSKQAHVQGFDCEYITFNKSVNMFERMEIAESIYEGVLEPSYKKSTRSDFTCAGHIIKKRGESALSHT